MQKGDYAAAKTALLNDVSSGKYTLVANFLENFTGDVMSDNPPRKVTDGNEFNSESIFEVAFVDKGDNNFNWGYNGEGATSPISTVRNQEYGIVWGNVIPSNTLLNEFEANDPRYKFTIFEPGDLILTRGGTQPGVALTPAAMNVDSSIRNGVKIKRVFRKYSIYDWDDNGFHPGGVNQRLIRYADVLLMLAECEAEIGTPSQAAAYINMVRSRPSVNMPAVVLTSKNQALRAVMHERAVELAAEAINNIDLLRWRKKGYFPSIMPDPKPNQVEFLPIPSSETSSNPLIK
jgi:starch-binding outer membrane protein, SusD/RagB family